MWLHGGELRLVSSKHMSHKGIVHLGKRGALRVAWRLMPSLLS